MKPVDQTTFGNPGGNCFSACVASILELPIEEVPYFMGVDPWVPGFEAWLEARGYRTDYYGSEAWCLENNIPFRPAPAGYSLMSGDSPRHGPGKYHTVVAFDGVMVHDPHPDRTGITSLLDYIVLVRA